MQRSRNHENKHLQQQGDSIDAALEKDEVVVAAHIALVQQDTQSALQCSVNHRDLLYAYFHRRRYITMKEISPVVIQDICRDYRKYLPADSSY